MHSGPADTAEVRERDGLSSTQVVTIPGAGFGPGGEGYLRFSAFAPREACIEARKRIGAMDLGLH